MPESPATQNLSAPAIPAWRGVAVGRYAVAAGEIQEYTAPTYGVDVHLSRPYQLEWKSGARFESTLMTASDICIAPAHHPITMRWRDDLEILSVKLEPQVVESTADDLKVRGQVEIPESHGASDSSVAHLCHALWIEAQAGYPTGRVFGESLSTALAASLLQRHSVRRAAEVPTNTLSPRSLRRVREYIEAHLGGDVGLEELARVAELSPYYFARCFKNSVGATPHQYVIERRVARAQQLLARSSLSVSEVAGECGFADQSHLTRHMKRVLGITPAALNLTYQAA